MTTRKSPLYSGITLLFGLVIMAGGAAKLYRSFSNLSSAQANPKVDKLLEASDAAVAEANQKLLEVSPAFQELLNDFDQMGVDAFRSEKRETCAKIAEQFAAANEHLQVASNSIAEAVKEGTTEKVTAFLMARSKSYQLLVKANTQNINIIQVIIDESMVDMDSIVEKVLSIAESRDADQKAANDATATADALLKQL